jgi:hypothetical protein
MSSSFAKTVANAVLEKTENEVVAVLIHLKKFLRAQNSLRSPLLRLPTEIVTYRISWEICNTPLSGGRSSALVTVLAELW